MPKHHDLKIDPTYFAEVLAGNKLFETRRNDRDFKKLDTVTLKEYIPRGFPTASRYTGAELTFTITHVMTFEQKENWVVFGIKPLHTESK